MYGACQENYRTVIGLEGRVSREKSFADLGGKTCWQINQRSTLCRRAYKSYILIDFSIAPKWIIQNFENLHQLDIFFQNLSLEYNTKLYKRESLIIFDEIQKCPKAREAIKHLVADRRYDYLETGSLISIQENVENIVIPSEERKIMMYPLDFEEFAWARGEHILLDYIQECYFQHRPLEEAMHKRAMRIFKEYMLVGEAGRFYRLY